MLHLCLIADAVCCMAADILDSLKVLHQATQHYGGAVLSSTAPTLTLMHRRKHDQLAMHHVWQYTM